MPAEKASALGRQIASAMAAAHAQGVVHGDLKPGNIMVTEAEVAEIMDFGLARRHAEPRSHEGGRPAGISGTPAYMSPEQARGEPPSPASDVFALGLILYEMVSGQKIVTATNLLEAFHRIDAIEPAALASRTAQPFADIFTLALVKDAARAPSPWRRSPRRWRDWNCAIALTCAGALGFNSRRCSPILVLPQSRVSRPPLASSKYPKHIPATAYRGPPM